MFQSLPEATIHIYAAVFRLVLGCIISDILHGCDFREPEIRSVCMYVYSLGVLFIKSYVGDTERKEWAIDCMRSAKDKKIVILTNLLVRVLNMEF
jgi:hypothetical protein